MALAEWCSREFVSERTTRLADGIANLAKGRDMNTILKSHEILRNFDDSASLMLVTCERGLVGWTVVTTLVFLGGMVALAMSYPVPGIALLVLSVHFGALSSVNRILHQVTKQHWAIAHLVASIASHRDDPTAAQSQK